MAVPTRTVNIPKPRRFVAAGASRKNRLEILTRELICLIIKLNYCNKTHVFNFVNNVRDATDTDSPARAL